MDMIAISSQTTAITPTFFQLFMGIAKDGEEMIIDRNLVREVDG
jgi:hypothetical protein